MNYIPYITTKTANGERVTDVLSLLVEQRIIWISGPIDGDTADVTVSALTYLADKSESPINLYINSPGGLVSAGLAIYDAMYGIAPKVNTFCMGLAASMGAVLLAGATGKRFALPHANIMIHQPLGGTQGQSSDIEIYTKKMIQTRNELYLILARSTGKNFSTIKKDCDRDNYMSAEVALEYGLIDSILPKLHEYKHPNAVIDMDGTDL